MIVKDRDHRKLGPELGLFTIDPRVGTGLILWKPRGAAVRYALEQFISEELIRRGYQQVYTPHIGKLELYRTSGHFPYYRDSQYPPMFDSNKTRVLNELWVANIEKSADPEFHAIEKQLLNELSCVSPETYDQISYEPGNYEHNATILRNLLKVDDGYLLRPMNCPHHICIYSSEPRSYRALPVRLAEFGTVYRYEQSGEVGGLTRVRGMTQDDAHIFCTIEQLYDELVDCIDMTRLVLKVVGMTDYRVRASLRNGEDKYIGLEESWEKSEAAILDVIRKSGMDWHIAKGEAAFYGPKIDFLVKDAIGREWQLGTVQCDYNLPERFDLKYIGPDNQEHRPIMIHRSPLGTLERFIGILIEHFVGAFPLWLAPVQVAVTTISEKSLEYGESVYRCCLESGLRCEADFGSEKIGPKKHKLRQQKIPYILVVGDKEADDGTVNVNDRDGKNLGTFPLEKFLERCSVEIQTKEAI